MSSTAENNKRIAKNTAMLYIRTFVILAIALYTSRLLLANLGVTDFGLYNLVAGVVGLFSSLKGVFASSVQRFLNYEKGLGNADGVHRVFCISVIVHILIAIVFALIVEAFGIWFINHKLNIPEGSVDTALFVFHCSIVTACITILSTPYDAAIIANEKMNAFAWISILDAVLKLIVIFLITILPFENIRSYAVLLVCIALLIRGINVLYCRRFPECRFVFLWDKSLFKSLTSFAGWNFFGNTAYALVNEGLNMMLNIYGGVVANAARGIAYQVRAAVGQLSGNLLVASQPYIIQQAAAGNREETFRNINEVSRILFFIMAITVLPLIVYCEQILELWLTTPPPYAVTFTRLILFYSLIRTLHGPIDLLFKALGKIRKYQILDSCSLLLSLPVSYGLLKMGYPIYMVFVAMSVMEIITLFTIVGMSHFEVGFAICSYLKEVIVSAVFAEVLLSLLGIIFYLFLQTNILIELIGYMFALVFISLVLIYIYILTLDERKYVLLLVNKVKSAYRWRRRIC